MPNGKKKGGKGERVACEFLKEWSGLDFRRTPQSGGLRGHVMDYTVGDIICTDDSLRNKVFPLTIEVKNYKKIDFSTLLERSNTRGKTNKPVQCKVDEWWEQTESDGHRGEKIPILMMRFDNLPKNFFYVVIDRKHGKSLIIPKDRLVTKKYIIFTSEELQKIPWSKFFKQAKKLWKITYG
jgi:hypothetical protein